MKDDTTKLGRFNEMVAQHRLSEDFMKQNLQQSTVEERFRKQFLCMMKNPLGWNIERIAYYWEESGKSVEWEDMEKELIDFIKSEIQLAEQKAREEEQERIIDIINDIASIYVSLPSEEVKEMLYKDDIINQITNSK